MKTKKNVNIVKVAVILCTALFGIVNSIGLYFLAGKIKSNMLKVISIVSPLLGLLFIILLNVYDKDFSFLIGFFVILPSVLIVLNIKWYINSDYDTTLIRDAILEKNALSLNEKYRTLDNGKFSISFIESIDFSAHPLLNKNIQKKTSYYICLKYLVAKGISANIDDVQMFGVFVSKRLKLYEDIVFNDVKDDNAEKLLATFFNNLWNKKYLYCLIVDIALIMVDEKLIINAIEILFSYLSPKQRTTVETILKLLFNRSVIDKKYSFVSALINQYRSNYEFMHQKEQRIIVTANMSAGKSTLINAVVGKKINKTQNEACTAKVHYIYNKPFEDGFTAEFDDVLELNANNEMLMSDNPLNNSSTIAVGTFFRTIVKPLPRFCVLDTPGVNSSVNTEHRDITYKTIETNDFDKIVCVLNASNIGTFDDIKHLQFIKKYAINKEIIVVINQIDKFSAQEDSIDDCVEKVKEDLNKIGIMNSIICPVSAYAGMLAKKHLVGGELDEIEQLELQMFFMKFKSYYSILSKYFVYNQTLQNCEIDSDDIQKKCELVLEYSGLNNLEKVLFL